MTKRFCLKGEVYVMKKNKIIKTPKEPVIYIVMIVVLMITGIIYLGIDKCKIECEIKAKNKLALLEKNSQKQNKKISKTVILDAGHGSMDSGSISMNGVYEKDIALSLTLKIKEYLDMQGVKTILTRNSDEILFTSEEEDLSRRIETGVQNKGDYFISIHLNSSEYNDGVKGFEIYTDFNDLQSYEMAETVLKKMDDLNYTENRGLKDTNETPLYIVNHNPISSLLIECGFISNDEDFNKLNNEEFQYHLAQNISKGIMEIFDE